MSRDLFFQASDLISYRNSSTRSFLFFFFWRVYTCWASAANCPGFYWEHLGVLCISVQRQCLLRTGTKVRFWWTLAPNWGVSTAASAWGARFCFLLQNLEQFRKKKCQWPFAAVELRIEFVFQSDSFIPPSIQLQCGSDAGNWNQPWKRTVIFGWVYFLFPAVRKSWACYMVNHRHWRQKTPFRSCPANLSGENSGYFCVLLYSRVSSKNLYPWSAFLLTWPFFRWF